MPLLRVWSPQAGPHRHRIASGERLEQADSMVAAGSHVRGLRPPRSEAHFYRLRLDREMRLSWGRLAQYGVLERFRGPQSHHCLRFDLDRLAGLRIAAHARLAMRLHRAPEVRNYEFSCAALALFHRQLEELFKKCYSLFFSGVSHFSARWPTILDLLIGFAISIFFSSSSVSYSSLCGGPNLGRARATL